MRLTKDTAPSGTAYIVLGLSVSTAVTGAHFIAVLVIWEEAIARHAAVGPRMALYRTVESRPVMAAGMMTRKCVGRKSI